MSRAAGGAGFEGKGRRGQRLGACSAGCQEREQPLGLSLVPGPVPLSSGWPWSGGNGRVGEGKVALTPHLLWAPACDLSIWSS